MQTKWRFLCFCLPLLFFASCGSRKSPNGDLVDSLNVRAYHFRYIDADSTERLARKALAEAHDYVAGRNEARCNLAFVAYKDMDFERLDTIIADVRSDCTDPLILLCADVLQMKACQRTGEGERFFQVKGQAEDRMQYLSNREERLSEHQQTLWVYAQTEYHLITSTYYFYQEQDSLARAELTEVPPAMKLRVDTVQWVYYNYMLGPGGLVEGRDATDITLQEFDYLFRAYTASRRDGLRYFEANSLQAFATMFMGNDSLLAQERSDAYNLLRFQHADGYGDYSLPMAFACRALELFRAYGDLFQTACAYRTIGEIQFEQGDYEEALQNYTQALHCVNLHHLRYYGDISPDTLSAFNPQDLERSVEKEWIRDPRISTVPEWIAGIRQQFSLTYSALGQRQASDYNRNFYLDLLQATSQNAELENRTLRLERQTQSLRLRMLLCGALLVVTLLMALLLRRRQKYSTLSVVAPRRRNSLLMWLDGQRSLLEDKQEELHEQLEVSQRRIVEEKRRNAENRAKVSLVHAIVPFLDRIGGEVIRMTREGHVAPERKDYIMALADQIGSYNTLLTDWIKMEQGQLRLHVSTFPVGKLFDIVLEGHYPFDQKHIVLRAEDTRALVKGDESLTLFMINTLADNARKFTPEGGQVVLSAEEAEDYVEIRVTDTGCGLSEADVETLNNNKVYDATKIGDGNPDARKGFGFGLMNCRGIIEKYKKTSSLFACCAFGVRSQLGQGSTFFFRLPRVVRMAILLLCLPVLSHASLETELYDSVYQANVEGRYADAVFYARGVLAELNRNHPDRQPLLLMDEQEERETADLLWAQAEVPADYDMLVGLRNEVALAALSLHDWPLYRYNNRICIRLHKYVNQDRELPDYYRRLQRTHRNNNILLMLIVAALIVLSFISLRLILNVRKRLRETNEMLANEHGRIDYEQNRLYVQNQVLDNCLSTIKHESMYYPSRIRQLVERMTDDDIGQLSELVQYYHHIYTLLCQQADAQVSQPGFKRQRISVVSLLERIGAAGDASIKPDTTVIGDESLICMLVESLQAGMEHDGAQIEISVKKDGDFVRFTLRDASTMLSPEALSTLFFPESGKIPYLVAKQIIREHDTYTNHPGLRLVAQPSEGGGYEIYFTLPLSPSLTNNL